MPWWYVMLSLRDHGASLNHGARGRGSGSRRTLAATIWTASHHTAAFDSKGAATYLDCKPSQPGTEPRARAPHWALRTRGPIVPASERCDASRWPRACASASHLQPDRHDHHEGAARDSFQVGSSRGRLRRPSPSLACGWRGRARPRGGSCLCHSRFAPGLRSSRRVGPTGRRHRSLPGGPAVRPVRCAGTRALRQGLRV